MLRAVRITLGRQFCMVKASTMSSSPSPLRKTKQNKNSAEAHPFRNAAGVPT